MSEKALRISRIIAEFSAYCTEYPASEWYADLAVSEIRNRTEFLTDLTVSELMDVLGDAEWDPMPERNSRSNWCDAERGALRLLMRRVWPEIHSESISQQEFCDKYEHHYPEGLDPNRLTRERIKIEEEDGVDKGTYIWPASKDYKPGRWPNGVNGEPRACPGYDPNATPEDESEIPDSPPPSSTCTDDACTLIEMAKGIRNLVDLFGKSIEGMDKNHPLYARLRDECGWDFYAKRLVVEKPKNEEGTPSAGD